MSTNAFSVLTSLHFGAHASRQAGMLSRELASTWTPDAQPCALLIVDPGIKGVDWFNEMRKSFSEAEMRVSIFDAIKPNPKDTDVYAAADILKQTGAGVIVAIGGGSTIDTAKGASLIAAHGGKVSDYAGWGKVPGAIFPIVAIPTTAGSGSEATSWAVITDTNAHIKLALGDRHLSPTVALLDPLLTLTLPPELTAATGMDALTHAIEAYLSPLSNPLNDLLALQAVRLIAANLRQAVENGQDLQAREAMLLASTIGGIVINNADVAGVHCLSEAIGSLYDAAHGLLNAVLLPYFLAHWQSACQERFARIAEALGVGPWPEEAVRQVVTLTQSLPLPSLKEIGVNSADLPRLAALAEANVSNSSNPLPMSAADYLRILELALTDRLP